MALMIVLIFAHASSLFHSAAASRQELFLQRKTMLLLDSLMKRSREDFGLACFDLEKKRALPVLCPGQSLPPEIAEDQNCLRKVFLVFESGEQETLFEKEVKSKNCLTLERLAIVKPQDSNKTEKALLGVEACA